MPPIASTKPRTTNSPSPTPRSDTNGSGSSAKPGPWSMTQSSPPAAKAQDAVPSSEQVPPEPVSAPTPPSTPASETVCNDGLDEDRDGLADCADADCFEAPNCQAGGREENTEAACRDWIDNDGDGSVDCDDQDCQTPSVRACRVFSAVDDLTFEARPERLSDCIVVRTCHRITRGV